MGPLNASIRAVPDLGAAGPRLARVRPATRKSPPAVTQTGDQTPFLPGKGQVDSPVAKPCCLVPA